MADRNLRCLLVSDFNVANFAGYLENDAAEPVLDPVHGEFGQVVPVLTHFDAPPWSDAPDFAVVWTRPEKVIPSFALLLEHRPVAHELLDAEVDAFTHAVLGAARRLKAVFVPTWTLDPANRGLGMADLRADGGIGRALLAMNLRLTANLDAAPNAFALDAQRWLVHAGRNAGAAKLWYQAKVPFGNEVFQAAVADVKAAVRGLLGQARKFIVLDLDDTLWGGVVGDVGWENLQLGGHDPAGEAFQDFQRVLKALTRRGVVLGIASKNEEATALAAIRSNPEMVLRESDFAGWRINWDDKAANIADLAASLNLGLQSVVFIDDNPVERARVRDALPEALVPEWPESPLLYVSALHSLRCFDAPAVSREDGARTKSYVTGREREASRKQAGSLDDWLLGLGIMVTVEPLSQANLRRATQLLNKTNQFNLATRRLTEPELDSWAAQAGRGMWTFRVSDKFGDAGLTGLASLEKRGTTAHVVDFLLSCRVLGRKVEETMVAWLVARAAELGAVEMRADFIATAKNKPVLDFWRRSGFECVSEKSFTRLVADGYPQPGCVVVVK